MSKILIVKTSSLGDIIQAFAVLDGLDDYIVDWVVEPRFQSIVAAHPKVRNAIPFNIRRPSFKALREEEYDLLFDLQGNCKSALISLFARAKVKVGYGIKTVREWPNVIGTHVRFEVPRNQNIRKFYIALFEKYLGIEYPVSRGVSFQISQKDEQRLKDLTNMSGTKIMVCPGSHWINKQLDPKSLSSFLRKIDAHFFLMWGNEREKELCEQLQKDLASAQVVERLSIPVWQNLMTKMDLVIAVDSAALHLTATTATPSFSIFGPTRADVFKPLGNNHIALQGTCPYGQSFDKQCPKLRSCPTGACIKSIKSEQLFDYFQGRVELKNNKELERV